MNHSDLIKELFKTYKLDMPIPYQVQEKLLSYKKTALKSILKEQKKYSLIVSMILSFYYFIRRFGLNLSIPRSTAVVWTASLATACIIFIGIAITLKTVTFIEPAYYRGVVAASIGNVELHRTGEEPRQANAGDVVKEGDTIVTGDRSQIMVQLGSAAIVNIQPQTTVVLSNLVLKTNGESFLKNGRLIFLFDKLAGDSQFSIKTRNAVAAVRGTSFSIAYEKNKTIVAVGEGELAVLHLIKPEKRAIPGGNTALITDSFETRPISKEEKLIIQKISAFQILEDIDAATEAEFEIIEKKIIQHTEKIDREIEELRKKSAFPRTLQELKEKYGRIDVVTLFSGKVYRGVIISRGSVLRLLTAWGIVNIPKKEVEFTRTIH